MAKRGPGFQKGNKHGKGRPSVPVEVKEAKTFNRNQLTLLIDKYIKMTPETLQDICSDRNTPAIDVIIIKVIAGAAKMADTTRLNFLIENLCGKLPTTVNLETNNHAQIVRLLERKRREIEDNNNE